MIPRWRSWLPHTAVRYHAYAAPKNAPIHAVLPRGQLLCSANSWPMYAPDPDSSANLATCSNLFGMLFFQTSSRSKIMSRGEYRSHAVDASVPELRAASHHPAAIARAAYGWVSYAPTW